MDPNDRFIGIEAIMKAKIQVQTSGIVTEDTEDYVFEEMCFQFQVDICK